jgi:hypothetical protein
MKYLRKYDIDMELIKEARWLEAAVMRADYKRDDEIREFFLELLDFGGRIVGIRNATHTIFDGDFEVKQRINYMDKEIYYGYTLGLRFDDMATVLQRSNTDDKMSKIIDYFNDFTDALMNIKDFGYKFKFYNFHFSDSEVKFNIRLYHPEDVVPWEHIFAYKEK